jgi:hypothetical protein
MASYPPAAQVRYMYLLGSSDRWLVIKKDIQIWGDWELGTGNRESGTGNREPGTENIEYNASFPPIPFVTDFWCCGNCEPETKSIYPLITFVTDFGAQREPGTGNREPGTGNREPGTGNIEYTASFLPIPFVTDF